MNMKKMFAVIAAMFVVSTAAYAVDLSVGVTGGAGIPFMRFTDSDYEKNFNDMRKDSDNVLDLSWNVQVDVLFTFIPYLALETGVGFSSSTMTYANTETDSPKKGDYSTMAFQRMQVYIPIMARGQYEYEVGGLGMLSYLSAGVKLGIPVADAMAIYGKYDGKDYYTTEDYYKAAYNMSLSDDQKKMYKAADFTMDVSFAIGQEFKLADVHYVGLRIGYDLNVLDFYGKDSMYDSGEAFMDSLNFNLTYRYSFGSVF